MTTPRTAVLVALTAVSALALAGCAGGAATPGASDADGSGDAIAVVTSTNVYGQVAEEIGGDLVSVTSIITSGSQDPHSFEASAQDQLLVSKAELIIGNGGGYDSFLDTLIESTGTTAPMISAVEFNHDWPGEDGEHSEQEHSEEEHSDDEHGEHEHTHIEGFNEHVWYDPHTMEHVAEAIAEELSALRPDDAATFEANAAEFVAGIAGLEDSLAAIDAAHAGAEVFVTEPVPVYLVIAAGLENVTPDAFSEAVEEGQDVPPATLLEALNLLESGDVRVVIANAQTGGAETTQVIDAAKSAAIPVLEFTETLPSGQTYLSWMTDNIAQLEEALAE